MGAPVAELGKRFFEKTGRFGAGSVVGAGVLSG